MTLYKWILNAFIQKKLILKILRKFRDFTGEHCKTWFSHLNFTQRPYLEHDPVTFALKLDLDMLLMWSYVNTLVKDTFHN